MEQIIGTREYKGRVDVTDPCYDRDTWCRLNDVEIKPGEYECWADVWDNTQTNGWGERVARLGIRLLGSDERTFNYLGEIGVDAGLAGFFEDKKDYTSEEWLEFCEEIDRSNSKAWILNEGFFSSSGYGDGGYPVYAARDASGQIVALEIQFISEDEEDDEEDEDWEDDEE